MLQPKNMGWIPFSSVSLATGHHPQRVCEPPQTTALHTVDGSMEPVRATKMKPWLKSGFLGEGFVHPHYVYRCYCEWVLGACARSHKQRPSELQMNRNQHLVFKCGPKTMQIMKTTDGLSNLLIFIDSGLECGSFGYVTVCVQT